MRLSFRYRITPNLAQKKALNDILWFCKDLYNSALEERISSYKKFGKLVTYYQQAKSIKGLKKHFSEAELIHSQTTRSVLKQLDLAYTVFFKRVKRGESGGFPNPDLTLSDRTFKCPNLQCNLEIDRDQNAAINIHMSGMLIASGFIPDS